MGQQPLVVKYYVCLSCRSKEEAEQIEDISLPRLKLEESGQLFPMNQSVEHICQTLNPHKVSEAAIHIFHFIYFHFKETLNWKKKIISFLLPNWINYFLKWIIGERDIFLPKIHATDSFSVLRWKLKFDYFLCETEIYSFFLRSLPSARGRLTFQMFVTESLLGVVVALWSTYICVYLISARIKAIVVCASNLGVMKGKIFQFCE